MPFKLKPEKANRKLKIDIPKEVDGYVKEWYLDAKKEDETFEQFTVRQLASAGLSYRLQKLAQAQQAGMQQAMQDLQKECDKTALDNNLNR